MTTGVEFTVRAKFGEYLIGAWTYWARKYWYAAPLGFGFVVVSIGLERLFAKPPVLPFWEMITSFDFGVFVVAACIAVPAYFTSAFVIQWFSNPARGQPVAFLLSPDRVSIAMPHSRSEIDWSLVEQATETRRFFFLQVGQELILFPKCCVPKADWPTVRELFRSNLIGKAKVRAD